MNVTVWCLAASICLVGSSIFFAPDGREQLARVRAERASIERVRHELDVEHHAMMETERRISDSHTWTYFLIV